MVSSRRLEGKVAIITGGSSGIGEATVRLFVDNGANVIIADIQDDLGMQLALNVGPHVATYKHCDVRIESDVEAVVALALQRWGKLDIMFNNAGIVGTAKDENVRDLDMVDFDKVMLVNLRGVALGIKHASRAMVEGKVRGSIICSASTASVCSALAPVGYTVSKHAVVGLVRAASSDLGKYGIRVNCVSPSGVVTPMTVNYVRAALSDPSLPMEGVQVACDAVNNLVMGRSLSSSDIAHAALYLASDDAAFVSGLNLMVDGGFTSSRKVNLI